MPSERATRSARVCQLFRCIPTLFFQTMSATTEVAGIGLLQVCLLTGGWEEGRKTSIRSSLPPILPVLSFRPRELTRSFEFQRAQPLRAPIVLEWRHGSRRPEIRRQQRGRRDEASSRRGTGALDEAAGSRRGGRGLCDGRHHRRSARPGEAGVGQPRSARARHAVVGRRAHLDGSPLHGAARAGRRRHQLHRQPVRNHHERSSRRRPHRRGASVQGAGRARPGPHRRRCGLSGRVVPPGGDDARSRRERHDSGCAGGRARR